MSATKTKRIQVTLDITIPADWTIGETEVWLHKKLRTTYAGHGWRTDTEVGMQRMKRDDDHEDQIGKERSR